MVYLHAPGYHARMNIFLGIIGAAVGFTVGVFMMELLGADNRQDPITSGLLALFVFGPAGAIGGVYLFVWLAMRLRGQITDGTVPGGPTIATDAHAAGETASLAAAAPQSVAKTGLKAIGIVVALVVVIGGGYAWHAYSTATPWLNPNNATVIMQFEIRPGEGVAIPASPQDLKVVFYADVPNVNFLPLPATLHRDRFRRDGDRNVIVGEVDLAFRASHRQLDLAIKGRPERSYPIGLTASAPHTNELGSWQKQPDGSEIRYRAKWPGRD